MAAAPIKIDGWLLDGRITKDFGDWTKIVLVQNESSPKPVLVLEVSESSPLGTMSVSLGPAVSMARAVSIGQTMAGALENIKSMLDIDRQSEDKEKTKGKEE